MNSRLTLFFTPTAAALSIALLLPLFPKHADGEKCAEDVAKRPFAELHLVRRTWNPVPAAEVFYPGPHCSVPPPSVGGESAATAKVAAAANQWQFDDFVMLHCEALWESIESAIDTANHSPVDVLPQTTP
ncbi:MAG: hypothetical protein LBI39_00545 [Puniceicoccales bacterium]|jgi:hypothetical protein|nr:hypothetical protein [Puniceicoccales bacterium]